MFDEARWGKSDLLCDGGIGMIWIEAAIRSNRNRIVHDSIDNHHESVYECPHNDRSGEMFIWHHDRSKPPTRSLVPVLLAWMFIGGQALLSAGSVYNYKCAETRVENASVSWQILGQSAVKMRSMATPANPHTVNGVAAFLLVANALGLVALLWALLSWSRSRHNSGRLTIAAAVIVIWVNSLLNLPYV